MHPARIIALAVLLAACTRRPSAELVLDEPAAEPDPDREASPPVDPRISAVCVHSFGVLQSESPSLRSPGIEQEFIARCIAGNQIKHAELGEQRWTERAACIEQAQTGDQLGLCDGRTPRVEPNPPVVSVGGDARVLCQRIFDMMMAENPDMAAVFGPDALQPILDDCATQLERERSEDPINFDREARCLMAAQSVSEFDKCDEP